MTINGYWPSDEWQACYLICQINTPEIIVCHNCLEQELSFGAKILKVQSGLNDNFLKIKLFKCAVFVL